MRNSQSVPQTAIDYHSQNQSAVVLPVDKPHRGRVLGWGMLMLTAGLLIVVHTAWIPLTLLILWGLNTGFSVSPALAASLFVVGVGSQVTINRTYPEWPINHLVRWRLMRSLKKRGVTQVSGSTLSDCVMMECIPRERWDGQHLDSATDVMMTMIGSEGLTMEGDRFRYFIAPSSILDVTMQG